MGRHRDPLWKWFDDTPVMRPGKVTACVTCKFCTNFVCAVTTSLKRHLEICRKRDPALLPDEHLPPVDMAHKRRAGVDDAGKEEAFAQHSAKRTKQEDTSAPQAPLQQAKAEKLLTRAVLSASMDPSVFQHPAFLAFFKVLAPDFVVPTPVDIHGRLLDAEYNTELDAIRSQLASSGAGVLALPPGETFLTLFTPFPCAIPSADVLASDSAESMAVHIIAARRHARAMIASAAPAFLSPADGHDGSDLWNLTSALPFLAFCADGRPSMPVVRSLLEKETAPDAFEFTYGDIAAALHAVCRDVCALPGPKQQLKKALALLHCLHDPALASLFENTCQHVLRDDVSLPAIFRPESFASIVDMLTSLDRLRSVITALPAAIANNDASSVRLDPAMMGIIHDVGFWKASKALLAVLSPLHAAIAYLQSSEATFSAIYAVFLHLKMAFLEMPSTIYEACGLVSTLHHEYPRALTDILTHHIAVIYSPVHALAFRVDPFFDQLRAVVVERFGASMLDLNHELLSECRRGLSLLCRKSRALEAKALSQFCLYCARTNATTDVFAMTKTMLPNCIWGQATGQFPDLSQLLVNVFACPATASRRRIRTSSCTSQKEKVALLAWNQVHRQEKQHVLYRDSAFAKVLARDPNAPPLPPTSASEDASDDEPSRLSVLLSSLTALHPDNIPDTWVFGAHANNAMRQLSEMAYGTTTV
ncbi:hypothetical protein SDRG_14911 [Saprolegnia diclina VS20]|uniref:BED-type domain-containing protein n=1 Tax=Saprolegnia diclina (strain VS20) TaxID=1156394 RepID=T0Q1M6_SAPDV|nr:hypothetical protein SDRG_14911 [Saprolegnia diclina VS20]EQC27290.1 hypothetical protein SDRG_14911 [Saprolegnia diclina VS20]|eukprot:XP_008619293.1 hypothetical protein SDRG_14911 [Saprolegnia diclina VS20]